VFAEKLCRQITKAAVRVRNPIMHHPSFHAVEAPLSSQSSAA
jgi:hypothetical protein